jgi:hypothetical protein
MRGLGKETAKLRTSSGMSAARTTKEKIYA